MSQRDGAYWLKSLPVLAIIFTPLLVPPAFLLLLRLPGLRRVTRAALQENHLIESLTFLGLFCGGIFGLWLARRLWKIRESQWAAIFYVFFSVGLLLTAMEEIGWGQQLFGFETPGYWKEINVQGETTLHNLAGVQPFRDHIRLTYAVGGLVGCLFTLFSVLRPIAPPLILATWFVAIGFWTSLEILYPRQHRYYLLADSIAELTELLVAASALLFLWLNYRGGLADRQRFRR